MKPRKMPRQKPGESKQDVGTPGDFLTAVKARLHIPDFIFDLAADDGNTVCPAFFTKEDDMLAQELSAMTHGWSWLNPEFGQLAAFVERVCDQSQKHGVKIAMLVPAATGANWWRDYILMVCAQEWRLDVQQMPEKTARIDAIFSRGGRMKACAEVKSRDFDFDQLRRYGSLIITELKLDIDMEIARRLKVPLLMIAGLADGIAWWKVTDKEGERVCPFESKMTETQRSINGGKKRERCAYLPVTYMKVL